MARRTKKVRCAECGVWRLPGGHSEAWCLVEASRRRMKKAGLEHVFGEAKVLLERAGQSLEEAPVGVIISMRRGVEEDRVDVGFFAPVWAVRAAAILVSARIAPWRRARLLRLVVQDEAFRGRFFVVLSSLWRVSPKAIPSVVESLGEEVYRKSPSELLGG